MITRHFFDAYQNHPLPSRILLTAFANQDVLNDAIIKGKICQYLKKPWEEAELILAIEAGYENYKLKKEKEDVERELQATNKKLEELLKNKLSLF